MNANGHIHKFTYIALHKGYQNIKSIVSIDYWVLSTSTAKSLLYGGFGSVVKHSTVDPGIASSTPSLQLKLLKGDMYWFFSGKMLPCISALLWAR